MEKQITLLPGRPDDKNRDYLPETLIHTDIVVNESGNNSQPYPENLKEYKANLVDHYENVWYEYVPQSYDPNQKCPLVFSIHGGIMTGWGQAVYTSWTLMAERDGFICVFPNACVGGGWQLPKGKWDWDPEHPDGKEYAWTPDWAEPSPDNLSENRDIRLLFSLIELMKEKYNIDEGRIFMQGMSMGNAMTSFFAREFGNVLAGAAGSGTAAYLSLLYDENMHIKNHAGHLSIWQSRPERNRLPELQERELKVNKFNRLYWMKLNECAVIPEISIRGEHNIAWFKGAKADLVYLDIKSRDHGQTFDDASLIWDYFFSGIRRKKDGSIVSFTPSRKWEKDKFAIAVTKDCHKAWTADGILEMPAPALYWQKLKYHGLNGSQWVRGEFLCVPLSFLATVFHAEYCPEKAGTQVTLHFSDGRFAQFAQGSIGCVLDNTVRSMYCEAVFRNKELYVSIEWFCRYLFDLHVSSCSNVIYITDHHSELSAFMADLISDILSGTPVPAGYDSM